jgi:hypothetical protein
LTKLIFDKNFPKNMFRSSKPLLSATGQRRNSPESRLARNLPGLQAARLGRCRKLVGKHAEYIDMFMTMFGRRNVES